MKYKSQHFVPQCYMRPFSTDAVNRGAIDLYNLRRKRLIFGASISGQCAKDYFYDKTGEIDEIFNGYEGKYSKIVKDIIKTNAAAENDLMFLRFFSYLQYLRTEAMAKFQAIMMSEMANAIFENDPEGIAWATVDPAEIPKKSIPTFINTSLFLGGLHDCLVINRTSKPFITSDNPSVIVNRFHAQKQGNKYGGVGLISSGFMLVFPISPRIVFVSYDGGVYNATPDGRGTISANRPRDIEALNALQVLKASANLYFSRDDYAEYVSEIAIKYSDRRPEVWHRWNFAVECEEKGTADFQAFKAVKNPAEMRGATH